MPAENEKKKELLCDVVSRGYWFVFVTNYSMAKQHINT